MNVARPTATRGDGEGVSLEMETESATCSTLMRSDPNMEMDTNEEVINTNIISSSPVPNFEGQTDPHLNQSTIPAVSFHKGFNGASIGVLSVVNVGEKHGDTLSSLMHDLGPKNPGMFVDGDPFLVKLQEIDRGLRKFDNSLSDKSGNSKLRPHLGEGNGMK